ncbi:hypothetical protein [Burkholderia sp. ABCPW 14]|uniref:hypothetical protein n=1 Tax=Burkholderia sp. ABCPW 14 TaxID=1637860 RepID=UPI0012E3AC59|nr:hypothetical protein [Burkholderia sp. ABCPW 14]
MNRQEDADGNSILSQNKGNQDHQISENNIDNSAIRHGNIESDCIEHKWTSIRNDINRVSLKYGSCYSDMVYGVNRLLVDRGIGITQKTGKSIIDNLHKVESGQRSQSMASLRESGRFVCDTIRSISRGNPREAAANASGVLLNGAGSMLFFAKYDEANLPSEVQASYVSSHP